MTLSDINVDSDNGVAPDNDKTLRLSVNIKPPEGYKFRECFVIYTHESVDGTRTNDDKGEFRVPDFADQFSKLVARNFGERLHVRKTESRGRGANRGIHLATNVIVDTPESLPKEPEFSITEKDVPTFLRKMTALANNEQFQAEAKSANRDPFELARERICAEAGVEVEVLRELTKRVLG